MGFNSGFKGLMGRAMARAVVAGISPGSAPVQSVRDLWCAECSIIIQSYNADALQLTASLNNALKNVG